MNKHFTSYRPMLMGTEWMITADHPLAVQAGAGVLQEGGNAVDAAIAANLVLTVVRPHMCGPGGDLFALLYLAGENRFTALNASGRAPARADLDFFARQGLNRIPSSGLLTATVPGAVHGWQEALFRYGTMTLDRLLGRAIDLAENGFPVYRELSLAIRDRRSILELSDAARDVFLPSGRIPETGELLKQPHLAGSLRLLAEQGPDAFYRGELARALVEFSEAGGGLFAEQDLAAHSSTWTEPLTTGYRDWRIMTHPPNSQGIALLMQADILENFDIKTHDPARAELIHLMVEAKKLAFADRDKYVCDPEFYPVPVDKLLDKKRAGDQAGRINPARAAEAVGPRDFTAGGSDTVYLTVVDGQGNAVALIQSIFESFGSGVMIPETGIILHNRGCGFSLDPDHVNRIEPGKRPYHTLHPAMIIEDGRPFIVLGTPGADGQTQTNIQLTCDLLDFQADVQQAMDAPRWRSEPDGRLLMEGRFPEKTIKALKGMGHQVTVLPDWHDIMGSSQAIKIDREKGVLMAGACPRRQAYGLAR